MKKMIAVAAMAVLSTVHFNGAEARAEVACKVNWLNGACGSGQTGGNLQNTINCPAITVQGRTIVPASHQRDDAGCPSCGSAKS